MSVDQAEWFYALDTTPPMISNYRAVVLDNGAIAVRAIVGDERSGIDLVGIATRASRDFGHTWRDYPHMGVQRNGGAPVWSWTVTEPFKSGEVVWLAIEACDRSGNKNEDIPADATMFEGPTKASSLLIGGALPAGAANRMFEVTDVGEAAVPDRPRGHTQENQQSADVLRLDERERELRVAVLSDRRAVGAREPFRRIPFAPVADKSGESRWAWQAVIP